MAYFDATYFDPAYFDAGTAAAGGGSLHFRFLVDEPEQPDEEEVVLDLLTPADEREAA